VSAAESWWPDDREVLTRVGDDDEVKVALAVRQAARRRAVRCQQPLNALWVGLVKVGDRQVSALRPAEEAAPLFDGLGDGRGVDDGQQALEVV
jgi:hypothetical protein